MRESYGASLSKGKLTDRYIEQILLVFKPHLKIEPIDSGLLAELQVEGDLAKLNLFIVSGNSSWQGLAVGFPGNTNDLSTANVGTPFLRLLLYPAMDLFQKISEKYFNGKARCLYFMGARFSDVFVRKFELASSLTPHLVILTNDLVKTIRPVSSEEPRHLAKNHEAYYQHKLCEHMKSKDGLKISLDGRAVTIKYVSHEVQTGEGTKDPERLDILGYDTRDHSLVAFEIKGPSCGKVQFENLFLQGLEHRNWIEKNKMAIKLIAEGPRGRNINTKKRTRLILGFCNKEIPKLFNSLKYADSHDKYSRIGFVDISKNGF